MEIDILRQKVLEALKAFKYNNFGVIPKTKEDKAEYADLVKKGLIKVKRDDVLKKMFNLGVASGILGHVNVRNWTDSELTQHLGQIKLAPAEQASLDFVRAEASGHLDLLFGRIANNMENSYHSRMLGSPNFRQQAKEALENKISNRKLIKELANDIRQRTQEYTRDMYRIAYTESQNAYLMGTALSEIRRTGKNPDEIYCARVPRGRGISCSDCIRLYLKPNSDEPKIFKLSDLLKASNIGKKRKNWNPVATSTHPFDACALVIVRPEVMIWDNQKKKFRFKTKEELND